MPVVSILLYTTLGKSPPRRRILAYAVCGEIAMRPLKRKVSITLDKDVIGMIRRFSEKEDRSFS